MLNRLYESNGSEICIIIIIIIIVVVIVILSFSFPFISKPEKRPTRGTRNRRRRGCSLVLFKKTSLKKRIRDGSRAAGGWARFFIQSSSTFYSSFSFSSFRPLTALPSPLVDPLPTHPHGSPRFFHGDEEIIGFLSLYIAPPSLPLLLPFPTGYSSIAFHRKAPKCSTLCVRYGDLFRQLERVSRFLCFSRCFSLPTSLSLSFFLPLSFSLAHRRTATVIVKNRSCHADTHFLQEIPFLSPTSDGVNFSSTSRSVFSVS